MNRQYIFAIILCILSVLPLQAAEPEDTASIMLEEVVVRPKKQKYSKKNNPAVALMERIRVGREQTDPKQKPYYSYDKYDRIVLALNDFNPPKDKGFVAKHLKFLFDFVDTSELTGKPILPVAVTERVGRHLYRRHPGSEKEVLHGLQQEALIAQLKEEGITKFIDDVLREIDIYGNDITLMQNRFVSPLSKIAGNYYKFFLDSLVMDGEWMYELTFAPHNPESMGFNGRMYIPKADSVPYVKHLSMQVPKAINLNYVRNLYVVQDFERDADGTRHKVKDDMTVEVELIPGMQPLYARRATAYQNFSDSLPPDAEYFNQSAPLIVLADAQSRDKDFWQEKRLVPVHEKELGVKALLAMLRKHKWFRITEKAVGILVSGYVGTGNPSKVDLGPVNTLISANTAEGARFRVGGMTTAHLSKHWFARGYAAYGTRDRKFKYGGELEYSFLPKKYHSHEFPRHSIMLSHSYDMDHLGQHYLFTNSDNVFLSLKRKEDDKVTYRRLTDLNYILELHNGFSLQAGVKMERQEPTRWLPFIDGYGNIHSHFNQSAFTLQLRFAPGETFYQTRSYRVPINMDAPIIQLTHEWGPKGLFGADFCMNKTELSMQKRFWFSAFGYADCIVKGTKIWSKVQYPALAWANANLSYTIQPESFALMNPMEFATDENLQWDLTYWGNGILFNRIPIVKYLRLREVIAFRGLWGHLTKRNNPEYNPELFRFPFDAFTKPMERTPYMEISAGIDNILTILRVDYVWRLTYRDTPNVDRGGVRISLHFTF